MKNWCKIVDTTKHTLLIYKDAEDSCVLNFRIDNLTKAFPKFETPDEANGIFETLGTENESEALKEWVNDIITKLEDGVN